jgi:hypothetical protein
MSGLHSTNASPRPRAWAIITALSCALAWATWSNPGYFSHDELSFLGVAPRWQLTLEGGHGFFRPLGALLIWVFVNSLPQAQWAHAGAVLLHTVNALLFWQILSRLNHPRPLAAALLFVASPLAAYSVGWTAALFDIGWVGMGLVAWTFMLPSATSDPRPQVRNALACLAYVAALLFKETALVIPFLLGGWIWFQGQAARRAHIVTLSLMGAITVIYLALRLWSLQGLAQGASGGYGLASPADLGMHLIAYWTFPLAVHVPEVQSILTQLSTQGLVALAVLHLLLAAWLTGQPRRLVAYVALYFVPLGPVLLIQKHETQYLYGTALVAAMLLTQWANGPWSRRLIALALVVSALHTHAIHRFFRKDGVCQDRFLSSLNTLNWHTRADQTIGFQVADGGRWWVIQRALVHAPVLVAHRIRPAWLENASPPQPRTVRVDAQCVAHIAPP